VLRRYGTATNTGKFSVLSFLSSVVTSYTKLDWYMFGLLRPGQAGKAVVGVLYRRGTPVPANQDTYAFVVNRLVTCSNM
jgi:hypothetical protein